MVEASVVGNPLAWLRRVVCQARGRHYRQWDRLPDGTPILGCPHCGTYVRRSTADPRPVTSAVDPRLRMSTREQYERRASAVRRLRAIRLRQERPSLLSIDGGKRSA